jgi:hypothetical protein
VRRRGSSRHARLHARSKAPTARSADSADHPRSGLKRASVRRCDARHSRSGGVPDTRLLDGGVEPPHGAGENTMSKLLAKPLSPIVQASLPGGGAALGLVLMLLAIPLV